MIEAIADLFVERLPVASPRTLAPATRLLAVDAAGQHERLQELVEAVEARGPFSATLVRLEDLRDAPPEFDAIWLIVGPGSDPAYCSLVHGELEERFPAAAVELMVVGADIDAAAMRGGPGWRRRAVVAGAAESLVRRLTR